MNRQYKRVQGETGSKKRYQFMSKFVIADPQNPEDVYLIRWRIIQCPAFAIYLHKIMRPDADPYPHDHPWWFIALQLNGGYDEEVMDKRYPGLRTELRRVRWVNFKRRDDAHYISHLRHNTPAWSIVIRGMDRRTWGFWMPVQHAKYSPTAASSRVWVHYDAF